MRRIDIEGGSAKEGGRGERRGGRKDQGEVVVESE